MKNKILCLFIFSLFLSENTFSQAGVLDNSFNGSGIREINFAGRTSFHTIPIKLQNGGYMTFGGININTPQFYNFQKKSIVKYLPNGGLDTTFFNGGITYDPSDTSFIASVKMRAIKQSNEKIVVGSFEVYSNGTDCQVVLRRYESNGTLDSGYGTNGSYIYHSIGCISYHGGMMVQADDKVIISITDNLNNNGSIYRLNVNGTPDSSFGTNGIITNVVSGNVLNLQSGNFISNSANVFSTAIRRWTANGFTDSSFGGNGLVIIDSATDSKVIVELSDSSIVFSGRLANKLLLGKLRPNGIPDSSFGLNGIAYTQLPIQPGSIVELASGSLLINDNASFGIYKFDKTGKIDSLFGVNGKQTVIAYPNCISEKIVKEGNDKLLIVGQAVIPPSETQSMFFARTDTNAILDLSYNMVGYDYHEIENYGADSLIEIGITPDGKIIGISITANLTGDSEIPFFNMLRLNTDASNDLLFGTKGFKKDTANKYDNETVLILNNGKYLVGGSWSNSDITLAKYNGDGTIDSSFALNGYSKIHTNYNYNSPCALDTDSYANIYRTLKGGGGNSIVLFRYLPNGTKDTSFGNNGVGYFPTNNLIIFRPTDVKVQSSAKPIVAGIKDTAGPVADRIRKVFLAVFNTDGTPDSSFNQIGYKVFNLGTDSFICRKIKIQNDGKIVGVGSRQVGGSKDIDIFVFRANADGNLDSTFGSNGFKVLDINNNSEDAGKAIEIQPDGKILLTGDTKYNSEDGDQFVVRLLPNGILDSTFGNGGIFLYAVSQKGYEHSMNCKLTNDNKLVVGGNFLEDVFQTKDMFVAKILLGAMTGVLEFGEENSTNVLLYPNPIQSEGNFEFELSKDENISIFITDIDGKKVEKIISNSLFTKGVHKLFFRLDETLLQGTYFIIFTNGHGQNVIKFLKN